MRPDGSSLVAGIIDAGITGGRARTVPVWRVSRDGATILDTLARINVQHGDLIVRVLGSKAFYTIAQPMSDATMWHASRNGRYYVEVDPRAAGTLMSGSPTVTVRSTKGDLIFRKEIPGGKAPFTDREFSAVVNELVTRLNAEGRRIGFAPVDEPALRRELFRPMSRLVATQVHINDEAWVLIRGSDALNDNVRYTVFRADGTIAGAFSVPTRQRVRALVGDQIWSFVERESGEIDVVRQRLSGLRR
jgi:hypothetical protein